MPKAMKPDARIADILGTLAKPVDYVAGIYGSFIQNSFDKERSFVAIGVSGKGVYPNYSIIEPCEPRENVIEVRGVSLDFTTDVRRMVFNGQNHQKFLEDSFWGDSWSSASMSFAEVEALLAELRHFKKKR